MFSMDDTLLCDEQHQDLDFGENLIFNKKESIFNYFQTDLSWEQDELSTLLSKQEKNTTQFIFSSSDYDNDDLLRKQSVDWMIKVSSNYGFVALTTILAVYYFDRFSSTTSFHKDKPWMNQLVAVTCLSLASKVEEIQAPLLLDLQQGSKFLFESKTIMKMELLVLSSLEWKMNPVTPVAYFDYFMRRLNLITRNLHYEFLRRCERILIAVINDSKFKKILPSVMAASIMCIVSKDIEPENALDYRNQLMCLLNVTEENIDECSKFIVNVSNNHTSSYSQSHKRKYSSAPGSPSGVVDAYFSSDNSNSSWAYASSVSSSPEALFKKNRTQKQQMRLSPVNRVSIDVLGNPH